MDDNLSSQAIADFCNEAGINPMGVQRSNRRARTYPIVSVFWFFLCLVVLFTGKELIAILASVMR